MHEVRISYDTFFFSLNLNVPSEKLALLSLKNIMVLRDEILKVRKSTRIEAHYVSLLKNKNKKRIQFLYEKGKNYMY